MLTIIETPDLYRCAYLLTQGGRIATTHHAHGQVVFVITGTTVAAEDLRYRTGQARVDPLQLREAINYLRDQVRDRLKIENRSLHHAPHSRRRAGPNQTRVPHSTPGRRTGGGPQTPR